MVVVVFVVVFAGFGCSSSGSVGSTSACDPVARKCEKAKRKDWSSVVKSTMSPTPILSIIYYLLCRTCHKQPHCIAIRYLTPKSLPLQWVQRLMSED